MAGSDDLIYLNLPKLVLARDGYNSIYLGDMVKCLSTRWPQCDAHIKDSFRLWNWPHELFWKQAAFIGVQEPLRWKLISEERGGVWPYEEIVPIESEVAPSFRALMGSQ